MKLLICVDLQNDFIDGTLGTKEALAIVPNVIKKLNHIEKEETLLLFTQDTHYANYSETLEGKMLPVKHCIENTKGWEINEDIWESAKNNGVGEYFDENISQNKIVKKTFGSDILQKFIEKNKADIDEIEFIGLCTDICVISNALMARMVMPDTRIIVDAKCCAGVTPQKHSAALEVMKSCQIEVINE